jgi:GABA permease
VWLTIAYCAVIVFAAWVNTWLGVAVFIAETAVLVWWLFRGQRQEPPTRQVPAQHPPGEKRLLVIANETVGGPELLAELKRHTRGQNAEVLVVVPALNSPLKHWVSDEDGAREAAAARLDASLEAMRAAGMKARGEIGDSDPLQAVDDAIRTFAPDELVISTHPEGRSNWLERGVVEHARERFDVPVNHVVVDLEANAAQTEPAEASS